MIDLLQIAYVWIQVQLFDIFQFILTHHIALLLFWIVMLLSGLKDQNRDVLSAISSMQGDMNKNHEQASELLTEIKHSVEKEEEDESY